MWKAQSPLPGSYPSHNLTYHTVAANLSGQDFLKWKPQSVTALQDVIEDGDMERLAAISAEIRDHCNFGSNYEMEFEKLASEKRYSCRSFEQRPIEKGDMEKILEAGRVAPTAGNFQPQRVIAINTPEGMSKLAQCTNYTYGAPAALIVCYDEEKVWVRNYDEKNSGDVDASIVTTQMMLQAAELDIGTCWIGHFDPWRIKELFNIPEHIVPVAILDMGYPGEKGKPHPVHWKRKALNDTVVYESF